MPTWGLELSRRQDQGGLNRGVALVDDEGIVHEALHKVAEEAEHELFEEV